MARYLVCAIVAPFSVLAVAQEFVLSHAEIGTFHYPGNQTRCIWPSLHNVPGRPGPSR
jgi:hypothetical protein